MEENKHTNKNIFEDVVSDAFKTENLTQPKQEAKTKEPDTPKSYISKHLKQSEKNNKGSKKPNKKKKTLIIIGIIVGVLCVLSILGAYAYGLYATTFEDDELAREELTQVNYDEPFYMLLVGTDTREGKSYKLTDGRSDSCILVRIDPQNYIVTMISIPRDTKIYENGYAQKFNSLYAAGGISSTIKYVKKMMNVEISHYAEISFNGLTDMIDAVGGVEVDVPSAIDDPNTDVYVPQGLHTLNGEEALSFSRSRRFGDGDFTRTADQRILIEALIKKAYKMGAGEVPNLLKAAKNFIRTDLRIGDMISLATQFINADQELTIYQAMVPSTTQTEDGVSYCITDKPALARMMKMVENGENPLYVEITSGASVTSSRDSVDLEKEKQEYYKEHPDSLGLIANSTYKDSYYYDNEYDDDEYGNSYSNNYSSKSYSSGNEDSYNYNNSSSYNNNSSY